MADEHYEHLINVDKGAMLSSRQKREPKYTQRALEEKLHRLISHRKSKMAQITAKMKEIDNMKNNEEHFRNVEEEILPHFVTLYEELIMLNESVVKMLPTDEATSNQLDWYEPRAAAIKEFVLDTERWIKKQRSKEMDDGVSPNDSVSMVSRRNTSSRSKADSNRSSSVVSCTSSVVRMKEEAKRAGLLAQAESLKRKQAIQLQEVRLKAEMEQLELDTAIAASTAKLKVFVDHESPRDDMNDYVATRLQTQDVHSRTQTSNVSQIGSIAYVLRSQDGSEAHAVPIADDEENDEEEEDNISITIVRDVERSPPAHSHHYVSTPRASNDNLAQAMTSSDRIYEVMQRQNKITELLVKQQDLSLLPKRDIPVFSGDPLTYRSFLRAFDNAIDSKTQNARDKLFFLEQYTSGEPQDLIRSCEHMTPAKGYKEARLLLDQQYGNELKIAMAYIEKALSWPQIKTDDAKGLNEYALFLIGCKNTMKDVDYMEEMDNPTNMRAILSKLPYKLREKWRLVAYEMMENKKKRPRFGDLVSFIDKQAKIVTHPLFGDLQGTSAANAQKEKGTLVKKIKANTTKSSSFVISVDTQKQKQIQSAPKC